MWGFLPAKIKNSVINSGVSEAKRERKKRKKEKLFHISAPGPGQGAAPAGRAGPGARSVLPRAPRGTSPWVRLLRPDWEAACFSLENPGSGLGTSDKVKVRGVDY